MPTAILIFQLLFCALNCSLMIPFLRFGEVISGGPHFPLTSDALKKLLTGKASWEVLQSVFHAVCNQLKFFNLNLSGENGSGFSYCVHRSTIFPFLIG